MNKIYIIITILLLAALGIVGYFIYQQRTIQTVQSFADCQKAGYPVMESSPRRCKTPSGETFVESTAATIPPTTQTTAEPTVTTNSQATASSTIQTKPLASPNVTYVEVPDSDKQQLQTRVTEPYILYSQNPETGRALVTLTISKNKQASGAEYPYKVEAVFQVGTEGSLITKTNNQIDWWAPTCMGSCPFTDTFKQKYPEIVSKAEKQ